jgi:hypothetical protein
MLTRLATSIHPPVGYIRDGKDHSLSCDPKYKPLLEHKATIGKYGLSLWGVCMDFRSLQNTPGLRESIAALIDDWNRNHKFYYLMNTLSQTEYERFLFNYTCERHYAKDGDKRLAAYRKQKEEEQKRAAAASAASVPSGSERNDDSSSSKDEFDRLQVISEYGW